MGSQTLEILRQGVWASLTGGWFYDPHQNVFSNAVHLYVWLILLCTPFVLYLYFPTTILTWGFYCLTVGCVIAGFKIINLALHFMYDKAQSVSDINLKKPIKGLRETTGDEEPGIEMQVLGVGDVPSRASVEHHSDEISCANSAMSFDYQEPVASTIDFKVDVHRKNSSESSDSVQMYPKETFQSTVVATHCAEICSTANHKRSLKREEAVTDDKDEIDEVQEKSVESGKSKLDKPISRSAHKKGLPGPSRSEPMTKDEKKRGASGTLVRQVSLDEQSAGINGVFAPENTPCPKLHRHRSSNVSLVHRSTKNRHAHSRQPSLTSNLYHENNFTTKSEMAIENIPIEIHSKIFLIQQPTPMRKDSNSTMSALQLPTASAGSSGSSRVRRHSNTGQKAAPIPTTVSVRRIKSAALETCCPQPSISNLSPHPNSAELIGGHCLRNPQHTMLPPPSKCLSRNPHLNLFPKGSTMAGTLAGPIASTSSAIDPVYPIAEQADEIASMRSMRPDYHDDTDDTDDDDDDDEDDEGQEINSHIRRQQLNIHALSMTESESDLERGAQTQSTDSDTENNGSRSPLLEVRSRVPPPIVMEKLASCSDHHHHHHHHHSRKTNKGLDTVLDKCKKCGKAATCGSASASVVTTGNSSNNGLAIIKLNKSEDSGCPSSDWEQASVTSKDMLLCRDNNNHHHHHHRHPQDYMLIDITKNIFPKKRKADSVIFIGNHLISNNNTANNKDNSCTNEQDVSNHKSENSEIVEHDGTEKENNKDNLDGNQERHNDNDISPDDRNQMKDLDLTDKVDEDIINEFQFPTLSRNLGAIPKTSSHKMMTTSSSSRRLSAGADDYYTLFRNHNRALARRPTAACISQTPAPFVLPFVGHRSEAPFLPLYIGPGTSLEYQIPSIATFRQRSLAMHEPFRHRPSKLHRSMKRKPASSIDTTTSSREDGDVKDGSGIGGAESEFGSSILGDVPEQLYMDNQLFQEYALETILPERTPAQTAILSIGQVDFGNSNFTDFGRHYIMADKPIHPKRYYNFTINCFGRHDIKILMDRLQLLALFDRDNGWWQVILAIILATLVAIFGSIILQLGFYDDIFAFIFCFVIAGSQYSLLKSVQPDAASPVHGFNKTVSYSRPIYFCLCSMLLIMSHHFVQPETSISIKTQIFGLPFVAKDFFTIIQNTLSVILLLFPIFFSLGLFPQVNTFLMYLLEQFDMHIFGGNAVCSLLAAILNNIKSVLACLVVYGPAFGGLSEPRGTQHVFFSIFCALLIPVAYHLSRCSSDFTCIWILIKSSLILHSDDDDEDDSEKNNSVPEMKSETIDVDTNNDTTNREENSAATTLGKGDINIPEIKTDDNVSNSQTQDETQSQTELVDPLPRKLQATVNARLKNDLLVCPVLAVIVLGLHCSTVFSVLQPDLNPVLHTAAVILGFLLHYIVPQLRKHLPWLCIARPVLRPNEFGQYEVKNASKIMWFESTYVCLSFFERNILYPLVFLSALTADSSNIVNKYGVHLGAAIVVICGLKCLRSSYSDPSSQYLILIFSVLFFRLDYSIATETFLVDYCLVGILYKKTCEFLLKMQFVVTYIAPWQITWGSAFHAFAQPFSVPHSAMLFLQAAISAILSTPLNPFLGSAIFLASYARPIKFWERDYNTRRIDHSNTRLSSQLERDLGADDNNLNSIFYEHLTRSLQHSLCGDLLLGRWGNVSQGDCFVLASDYLNCLVHIIELGNGLCTFQMRGLEFRGTYCQQREVEAISEGVEENAGCCCCSPGHLPRMLSANAMFATRWLAWQVIAAQYVLEGYSISDNSAIATLQVFEFRRVLITYYVKSIIYYVIRSPKLNEWLTSSSILDALQATLDKQYVDLDPIFNYNLDEDYDCRSSGITRASFCSVYFEWIMFCCTKKQKQHQQQQQQQQEQQNEQQQQNTGSAATITTTPSPRSSNNPTPSPRDMTTMNNQKPVKNSLNINETNGNKSDNEQNKQPINMTKDSPLVSLCLALGLLGRRTLATASHSSSSGVELFLHGLHSLFKGDFRITSPRDEWVFADMELLHGVVAPAVRMSLKLHQDHFMSPDEYDDPEALYDAINMHTHELVISHEADPLWRNAVLRGAPNLLALRHVMDDGSDEYRVIRLTKRYLSFRVIKLNRECVRGLWAGQQQELIYLRNRNPERGSIQNAKQALRNIINSSCDQPIGYPIYVSPLTTSYAETNEQICRIIGGSFSLEKLRTMVLDLWGRVRQRCREGCSSGSSAIDNELGDIQGVYSTAPTPNNTLSAATTGGGLSYGSQSMTLAMAGNRGSLASMGKPTSSTLLAGFLNRERDMERESVRERGAVKRSTTACSNRMERERERRATLPATTSSPAAVTSLANNNNNNPNNNNNNSCNNYNNNFNNNRNNNNNQNDMSEKQSGCSINSYLKQQESIESCNISTGNNLNINCIQQRSTNSSLNNLSTNNNNNNNNNSNVVSKNLNKKLTNSNKYIINATTTLPTTATMATTTITSPPGQYQQQHLPSLQSATSMIGVGNVLSTISCNGLNERHSNAQYHHQYQQQYLLNNKRQNDCCSEMNDMKVIPSTTILTTSTSSTNIITNSNLIIEPLNIPLFRKVIIVDAGEIYDCLDLGRRIDVVWPNEKMRSFGGRSSWKEWQPLEGMVGFVVHYWQPNHYDMHFRSNVNRTLLLIQIGERYVPIGENGVKIYNTSGEIMQQQQQNATVAPPVPPPLPVGPLTLVTTTPIVGTIISNIPLTILKQQQQHSCEKINENEIIEEDYDSCLLQENIIIEDDDDLDNLENDVENYLNVEKCLQQTDNQQLEEPQQSTDNINNNNDDGKDNDNENDENNLTKDNNCDEKK